MSGVPHLEHLSLWRLKGSLSYRFEHAVKDRLLIIREDDGSVFEVPLCDLADFHRALTAVASALGKSTAGSREAAKLRERYPHAYTAWTQEEEARLREMHEAGNTRRQIADTLGRQPTAVRSRLEKLGFAKVTLVKD